jgi:hypothetical protein
MMSNLHEVQGFCDQELYDSLRSPSRLAIETSWAEAKESSEPVRLSNTSQHTTVLVASHSVDKSSVAKKSLRDDDESAASEPFNIKRVKRERELQVCKIG